MTVQGEICDGDTVLSRARVVVVFVDPATGKPAKPTDDYRERLTAAVRRC
jgi:acyl-CoA thioester hydrolase